jgi:hypothetical protein
MSSGNELEKHHGLQLWMIEVVKSIAQVKQAKALNNPE